MPAYDLFVSDRVGTVRVTKKRGMRSIRMRITAKGDLAVSAPSYVTKAAITEFIQTRHEWIIKHLPEQKQTYYDGMYFGRGLRLYIRDGQARNSSKVTGSVLWVKLAGSYTQSSEQTAYIERKLIAALQTQAERLLLPRLQHLAETSGHSFNQAYVKRLSSRWGSCDSQRNITLNLFLLQLPDQLVDYVIYHELTHTKHMNHSPTFWGHLAQHVPNYAVLRKQIRAYNPHIAETAREPNALMA